MATHSRIPTWRIPIDRGAWQATVHAITESDTTERLSTTQEEGLMEGTDPGARALRLRPCPHLQP